MLFESVQLIISLCINIDNVFNLAHMPLRHHPCANQNFVLGRQIYGHGLYFTTFSAPLVLWTALQEVEVESWFVASRGKRNSKFDIDRLFVLLCKASQNRFHQRHKLSSLQKTVKG